MENINQIIINYLNKSEIDFINMFYDIGEYIVKENINIDEIELYLKNKYGIVIAFTKRNLKNMILLYNKYDKNNLSELKKYDWLKITQILKNKKINNYVNNNTLEELKKLKKRII